MNCSEDANERERGDALESVVRRAYAMAVRLDCEYTKELDDLICLLGDTVRELDKATAPKMKGLGDE